MSKRKGEARSRLGFDIAQFAFIAAIRGLDRESSGLAAQLRSLDWALDRVGNESSSADAAGGPQP